MKESLKTEEELKKCPFCAEMIKEEAKFCKHCGKDISNENEAKNYDLIKYIENKKYKGEKISYLKTEENKVFIEYQNKKFSLLLFIILCILWIIPGILYIIYWAFNKNKKQTYIIKLGQDGEVINSFGINNNYFENYNNQLGIKIGKKFDKIKDDRKKQTIIGGILLIFIIFLFQKLINIGQNSNINIPYNIENLKTLDEVERELWIDKIEKSNTKTRTTSFNRQNLMSNIDTIMSRYSLERTTGGYTELQVLFLAQEMEFKLSQVDIISCLANHRNPSYNLGKDLKLCIEALKN